MYKRPPRSCTAIMLNHCLKKQQNIIAVLNISVVMLYANYLLTSCGDNKNILFDIRCSRNRQAVQATLKLKHTFVYIRTRTGNQIRVLVAMFLHRHALPVKHKLNLGLINTTCPICVLLCLLLYFHTCTD